MSLESIFLFIGGIIGGGGLVKAYQSWLEHKREEKSSHKYAYREIIDRLTEEIKDIRSVVEQQRGYISKLEQDISELKRDKDELIAQNVRLELRANLYEEQAESNRLRAEDNEKELKRVSQLLENEKISKSN